MWLLDLLEHQSSMIWSQKKRIPAINLFAKRSQSIYQKGTREFSKQITWEEVETKFYHRDAVTLKTLDAL